MGPWSEKVTKYGTPRPGVHVTEPNLRYRNKEKNNCLVTVDPRCGNFKHFPYTEPLRSDPPQHLEAYLWLVGNGGMGYNYIYYYYHSSIPY